MDSPLKAPFPWPGGKSTIAAAVWARLGDCGNFVEPFCGSSALTLARPHDLTGKTETINDADGLLVNALRSIAYAPNETAHWCDWPVSECDLTAAHLWLKAQREELTQRLFADPDYCDPKAAGRWLWGIASWIGDGWCVADGPWINQDGRLVDRRTIGAEGEGVRKKMPNISATGYGQDGDSNGIQSYRDAPGVPRKMPEIGKSPNGQIDFNRKGVQAYRYQEGVRKKMPLISARGGDSSGTIHAGVQSYTAPAALLAYFDRLAVRLRRVRILCGDWKRVVKPSITVNHGLTGLFLDPPYPQAEHGMAYHGNNDIWHDAAAWAVENGDDPLLRICIAGYFSEATDLLFPASWERLRWQARGGYSNQSEDGRGRANAKRECLWFSPGCLNPADDAKDALSRPIAVRDSDYTGTLFEVLT